jgi:hypothetical protein
MSTTPSHVVLSPSSTNSNINLIDFSKVGLSPLASSTAFKKIQYFSKVSPQSLYTQSSIENKYSKLSDLYLRSSNATSSYNYGTQRQQNYTTSSNQLKHGLLDKNSVTTLLDYNYNISTQAKPSFSNEHTSLLPNAVKTTDLNLLNFLDNNTINSLNTSTSIENRTLQNSTNSSTDIKGHANSLKYFNFSKGNGLKSLNQTLDLQAAETASLPSSSENESGRTFKFKDIKSPNLGFLSSEKNIRLVNEVNPSKFSASMLQGVNNLDDIVSTSINESILPNQYAVYSSSKND